VTRESVLAIAITPDEDRRLLVADVRSARARVAKAVAGDRIDVARFEVLSADLERWAYGRQHDDDAASVGVSDTVDAPGLITAGDGDDLAFIPHSWRERFQAVLDADGIVVTVRAPLLAGAGAEATRPKAKPVPEPVEAWRSKTGARGTRAVQERFEAQIEECLSGGAGAISPSDIQNTVLTETLRRYVGQRGQRRDVPVEYRDGSRSRHTFPLRSLKLATAAPSDFEELRLALLSIRHTEMDAVVDGAFLRNAEISQPRPAADTDDLVFEISREQLLALTADGSRSMHLRIYQTGLDTAIVGFYRAVVRHLLDHPGTLAVTPMFFQDARPPRVDRKVPGEKRPPAPQPRPGPVTSAGFREGEVWATR
jgi:hypothetical protein